jgi:CcmD family protein
MTTDLLFLFVGFSVVWLGIFGYLLYVTGRVRSVSDELRDVRGQLDLPEAGQETPSR